MIEPNHNHNVFYARKCSSCGSGISGNFDNRPGALLEPNHFVSMKHALRTVDSPSTSRKISFAVRSTVAGKSGKKTQLRIGSFRFFIPPPKTVKEETSDGRIATTEQTPTTRQQEETNI